MCDCGGNGPLFAVQGVKGLVRINRGKYLGAKFPCAGRCGQIFGAGSVLTPSRSLSQMQCSPLIHVWSKAGRGSGGEGRMSSGWDPETYSRSFKLAVQSILFTTPPFNFEVMDFAKHVNRSGHCEVFVWNCFNIHFFNQIVLHHVDGEFIVFDIIALRRRQYRFILLCRFVTLFWGSLVFSLSICRKVIAKGRTQCLSCPIIVRPDTLVGIDYPYDKATRGQVLYEIGAILE